MNKGALPQSINEIFERVKKIREIKSQKELIEEIGITRSFFFSIKKGDVYFSDATARKLAQLAELPTEYVLMLNIFEKCKDTEAKEAYRRIISYLVHIHFTD